VGGRARQGTTAASADTYGHSLEFADPWGSVLAEVNETAPYIGDRSAGSNTGWIRLRQQMPVWITPPVNGLHLLVGVKGTRAR